MQKTATATKGKNMFTFVKTIAPSWKTDELAAKNPYYHKIMVREIPEPIAVRSNGKGSFLGVKPGKTFEAVSQEGESYCGLATYILDVI